MTAAPLRHDAPFPIAGAPPAAAEQPARRRFLATLEKLAPAIIFLLIALFLGVDLVDDLTTEEPTGARTHLAGMAVGIVLSLAGLAVMLRLLGASRARASRLATALERSRADGTRWQARAALAPRGLGDLVDERFAAWNLSPSEREIAMLLLKGISLREIAGLRRASATTVRQQAHAIYRKANVAGRIELAAYFLDDLLLSRDREAR